MATTLLNDRRFVVLLAILALLLASLTVSVRPASANGEGCTGGYSEIVDAGDRYIVKGTKGNDWIDCGSALKPVEMRGGAGNDYLWGSNDYNDTLMGGHGDDWLYGNSENDLLMGGHGDDYMDGGNGVDVCLGGRGLDWFGISTGGCETADLGQEP